jgi:hypothetical protein
MAMTLLVFFARCRETPAVDVGLYIEVPVDDNEDTVDATVVVLAAKKHPTERGAWLISPPCVTVRL